MALRRTNRGRPRSSAQRQRSSQSVSQLFHGAHKLDSHSALAHSIKAQRTAEYFRITGAMAHLKN